MDFQHIQYQFAAHIRNPETHAVPEDVERRRMKIYTDLLYNNIEGFVSGSFPVLRSLYGDNDWHKLVRSFFEYHHCSSPYFLEISQEFIRFLQESYTLTEADFPFMIELAHYEWVELALDVSEETIPVTLPSGDLLSNKLVVSPVVFALAYQYPVHKIGPKFTPDMPGSEPTYLMVYRNRADEVRFMETNAVTMRMINVLQVSPQTGLAILQQIAEEIAHPNHDALIEGGHQTLRDLESRDIISVDIPGN